MWLEMTTLKCRKGMLKATSMHTKETVADGIKPCGYKKKMKNRAQNPATTFG